MDDSRSVYPAEEGTMEFLRSTPGGEKRGDRERRKREIVSCYCTHVQAFRVKLTMPPQFIGAGSRSPGCVR
jgi:hypothetical protein